jgi:hypothetical protein
VSSAGALLVSATSTLSIAGEASVIVAVADVPAAINDGLTVMPLT